MIQSPLARGDRAAALVCAELMPKVLRTARRLAKRYGIDPQEAQSEAAYYLLEAFADYKPDLGRFAPRVHALVKHRVASLAAQRTRRAQILKPLLGKEKTRTLELATCRPVREFREREFDKHLSADARHVLALVFAQSDDFGLRFDRAPHGGATKRTVLHILEDQLVRSGWDEWRVGEAFAEIQESLNTI